MVIYTIYSRNANKLCAYQKFKINYSANQDRCLCLLSCTDLVVIDSQLKQKSAYSCDVLKVNDVLWNDEFMIENEPIGLLVTALT